MKNRLALNQWEATMLDQEGDIDNIPDDAIIRLAEAFKKEVTNTVQDNLEIKIATQRLLPHEAFHHFFANMLC